MVQGGVVPGGCGPGGVVPGGCGPREGLVLGGVGPGGVWSQGGGLLEGGVPCDLSHHAFDVMCMLPPHQLRPTNSAAAYILLVM